jgi:hypothetical protein
MAKSGNTDTDMGLKNIFAEIEKFKNMVVKVGVTEDVGKKLAMKKQSVVGKRGKKLKRKKMVESTTTLLEIAAAMNWAWPAPRFLKMAAESGSFLPGHSSGDGLMRTGRKSLKHKKI